MGCLPNSGGSLVCICTVRNGPALANGTSDAAKPRKTATQRRRVWCIMANRLLDEGIYVVGFSFPVVPKGQARIRTQMSAAHEVQHIERAVTAFAQVGRELGVIK